MERRSGNDLKETTILRPWHIVFVVYISTERRTQKNMPENHISLLSEFARWDTAIPHWQATCFFLLMSRPHPCLSLLSNYIEILVCKCVSLYKTSIIDFLKLVFFSISLKITESTAFSCYIFLSLSCPGEPLILDIELISPMSYLLCKTLVWTWSLFQRFCPWMQLDTAPWLFVVPISLAAISIN